MLAAVYLARNVPAYPDGVAGEALLERLAEQLGRYDVQRSDEPVSSVDGRSGAGRCACARCATRSSSVASASGPGKR
jgi:thioredoxin reductase